MATDLSAVTETIKTLVNRILLENDETMVTATAAPPDASLNENKVSVYLYHVLESPEFKNLPPTNGSGPVPIQHAPMGLILQYIITVIHGSSENISNDSVIAEQKILGFVARAIHDFPVISATTRIPVTGQPDIEILHQDLIAQKNTLRLNLRPATREETVAFWSSSDDKLPRLSLFLEVRVAILDPRTPLVLPGIVLTVGNFIFPGGPPQLTLTRNVLSFFPPESISTEIQSITASPARPTLLPLAGDTTLPSNPDILANSVITIEALDIRPGMRFLVLKSGTFEVMINMDRPADNPDWAFSVSPNLVSFSLRRTAIPRSLDDVLGTAKLLDPGVYSARVLVKSPNFGDKPQSTNEIAFTAIPQITAVDPTTTPFQVRIAGKYFGHEDDGFITERDIVLAVRGTLLQPRPIGATLAAGQFRIFDTTTSDPTEILEFTLPTGFPTPPFTTPLAVNLIVRGATATPAWLEST